MTRLDLGSTLFKMPKSWYQVVKDFTACKFYLPRNCSATRWLDHLLNIFHLLQTIFAQWHKKLPKYVHILPNTN